MKRLHYIDALRGIVMIIMALDHVRDLLHTTSITQQPTTLATTTPALFFTRWVTHLCAPTFVFLSGVSAWLSMKNRADVAATRKFLFSRGLWLILVEFTLVNFGIWFDIHFAIFFSNVIAAIGFGFIVLALLLSVSQNTIGIIGLSILFLHNLAPLIPGENVVRQVLTPLFSSTAFPIGGGTTLIIGYPPIPWLGILLTGFGVARFFTTGERQRSLFLRIGLGAIALFLLLRFINIYGDPAPWSQQKNSVFTFLSFINLTKYPPSLQFSLLFLGIMFLIAAVLLGRQNRFTEIAAVYGKVPLFYFVVHWYIIHPLVFIMVFAQGFTAADMVFGSNFGRPKTGGGLALWAIYLVWIGVVVLMYPICKCYGRYKEQHKDKKWTRYI